MIYNTLFAALLVLNIAVFASPIGQRILYWGALIFLFLFVAFRWRVGCDWSNYLEHAEKWMPASYEDALHRKEPAYWMSVFLIRQFGLDWFYINVLTAIFFFLGLHFLASRQPNPVMYLTLSFPILITGVPMATLRQATAMGFIYVAYNAFTDRRRFCFIGSVLAAMSWHTSAVAFIAFAPFLYGSRRWHKLAIGAAFVPPILYAFATSEAAQNYTLLYVGTTYDATGGPARTAMVTATACVFLLFLKKKWRQQCPRDFQLTATFANIMLLLLPITFYSSVIGDRFGYYMMPLAFVIQSRAYFLYPDKLRFIVFLAPLLIGGFMLLGWTQFSALFQVCYLSYQTWLAAN